MGCDIHAHAEVKINGVWYHLNYYNWSRNYDLFAKMAGVRNYENKIVPISKPRGVPCDMTFLTQYDCDRMGTDGHSHSWLNAAEVVELNKWWLVEMRKCNSDYYYEEELINFIFGNGWDQFTEYRDELREGLEDARIIFWFDN